MNRLSHLLAATVFLAHAVVTVNPALAQSATQSNASSGNATPTSTASASQIQVIDAASLKDTILSLKSNKSVAIDFSTASSLSLNGVLNNQGSIYVFSTNPQISSISISAANITNSGLISSILPAGGIPGITNAVTNLSMTLVAANNIVNAGSITSAGSLSLVAGGSISNVSQALMQSISSLNLYSSAGSILNQGVIASAVGNLNINSSNLASILGALPTTSANLSIENTAGILSAINGNISVCDQVLGAQKPNLNITGGVIEAKEINLFSANGSIDLFVDDVRGVLNISAAQATVVTSSPAGLNLGRVQLSGDPLFYNSAGDVIINTDLAFPGQPLSVVASGNIVSTGRSIVEGSDVALIAGANIAVNADHSITLLKDNEGILFGSPSGGKIDLTAGGGVSSIKASGSLLMMAFNGSDPESGRIATPANTPLLVGDNVNPMPINNVYIYAGTSIDIGDVVQTIALSGNGALSIYTRAQPLPIDPQALNGTSGLISFAPDGALISPSVFQSAYFPYNTLDFSFWTSPACLFCFSLGQTPYATLGSGSINVGNITTDYSSANLSSGSVAVSAINAGGPVTINATSPLPFTIGGFAGSNGVSGLIQGSGLTLNTKGDISINNMAVNLFGTGLNLNSLSGSVNLNGTTIDTGNGGNLNTGVGISITAGKDIAVNASNLATGLAANITAGQSIVNNSLSASSINASQMSLLANAPARGISIGSAPGEFSLSITTPPAPYVGTGNLTVSVPGNSIVADLSSINSLVGATFVGSSVTLNGGNTLTNLSISASSSMPFVLSSSQPCVNCLSNNVSVSNSLSVHSAGDLVINQIPAATSIDLESLGSLSFASAGNAISARNLTLAGSHLLVSSPLSISYGLSLSLNFSGDVLDLGSGQVISTITTTAPAGQDTLSISAGQLTVPAGFLNGAGPSNVTLSARDLLNVPFVSAKNLNLITSQTQNLDLTNVTVSDSLSVTANGGGVTLPLTVQLHPVVPFPYNSFMTFSALKVVAKGDILVPTTLSADASTSVFHSGVYTYTGFNGPGADITLTSTNGDLVFRGATNISSNGSIGGNVSLSGMHLNNGGSAISINSVGTVTGNFFPSPGIGGTIKVEAKAPDADLQFGPGGFTVVSILDTTCIGCPPGASQHYGGYLNDARGDITLISGRDLQIDPTSVTGQHNLYFEAGRNLQITGNLSAPMRNLPLSGHIWTFLTVAQEYGSVTLKAGSVTPFLISGGSGCANCITGSLIGAAIPAQLYMVVFGAFYASTGAVSVTAGGDMVLSSNSLSQLGYSEVTLNATGKVISQSGSIALPTHPTNDGGALNVNATALQSQTPGGIILSSDTAVSLSVASNIQSGTGPGQIQATAPSVSLSSTGSIALDSIDLATTNLTMAAGSTTRVNLQSGSSITNVYVNNFETANPFQAAFTVGGAIFGSGMSGDTSTITSLYVNRPAGTNLNVNNVPNLQFLAVTGGPINVTGGWSPSVTSPVQVVLNSTGSVNFNVPTFQNPESSYPALFAINATGDVTVNAQSLFIYTYSGAPAGFSQIANIPAQPAGIVSSAGTVTLNIADTLNINVGAALGSKSGNVIINSSNVVNDGIISVVSPRNLFLSSNSNIDVSGAGYILGNVFFTTPGAVNISQAGIVGAVQGFAGGTVNVAGGFVVRTDGTTSVKTISTTALSAETVAFLRGTVLSQSAVSRESINSNALVATDSQRRSLSFNMEGADDSGVAKIGNKKYIVTNSNQNLSFCVARDDSVGLAEEGTEISEEEGELYLSKGKLVVSTTDQAKLINTAQGRVIIDKSSTAMVRVSVSGTVSVVTLGGGQAAFYGTDNSAAPVSQGEELLANAAGLEAEELVAADGIERGDAISAGITKTQRTVVRRTISLKQIIDKDVMINNSLIHIKGVRFSRQQDYAKQLKESASAQSAFKPIAFLQPVLRGAPSPATSMMNVIISSDSCRYRQSSPNLLVLQEGTAFIRPSHDITVRTEYCDVLLKKGAAASISTYPGHTIIRSCSGAGCTTVRTIRHAARLNAGEELMVSKSVLKEKDIYRQDEVTHRSCLISHIDGFSLAHSEFSLPSFLSLASMRELRHPTRKDTKLAGAQLMKSAVALQLVKHNRGTFR